MKKIGIILAGTAFLASAIVSPVMAETSTSTPKSAKPILNVACMQAALDKRDGSVSASLATYASSVNAAIAARTSSLKAAWALAVAKDRRTAIRSAWSAYRVSAAAARSDFKKAKSSAWTTFYADRKACGPQHAVEDSTTQSVDNNL